MIRKTIAAATAALLLAPLPASAQSQQEALDARYDRALAAGYKALFLCSAIANAERNGATRTPESVHEWELTGIQAPLDDIVQDLPYEIVRRPSGEVLHVLVEYTEDWHPRIAVHEENRGCSLHPIGSAVDTSEVDVPLPPIPQLIPVSPQPRIVDLFDDDQRSPTAVDVSAAFSGRYGDGTRTTAAIVIHKNKVAAEQYMGGFTANTPQRTWSVAKSIAATLVGYYSLRFGDGIKDMQKSAVLGEDDSDPRNRITFDHLLRMASGRYSDTPGNRTDPLYFGGSTVDETAAHWPLISEPGTEFRYANNDTLMAVDQLSKLIEDRPPSFFFSILGLRYTVAEKDWQGDYILSSQVWSTARDFAKLGALYLNDGVSPRGTRLLPEGWTEYVSSPSGPQPEGRTFGYGAGFWLLNNSEGVPSDTFAALGNRGQHIVIVPSRNVVIVRRGEDPVGSRFDIAAFTKDVLAALEE